MLQRIQSIYLLIASLALFALFLFPLVHNVYYNNKPVTIMVTGIYEDVNGKQAHTQFFITETVITAIVSILPIILIFLYKNRKQQIYLGYLAMVIVIAYSFWLSHIVKIIMGDAMINTQNGGIGLLLSSISLVFILLAIMAIQRDEKLVKSADRLR
jgi:uncharacterized membrane protein HdeD (DUF308 family)